MTECHTMKRSHRVALTAVTTTAVLAGAGSALAFSSLHGVGTAAPVAGAVPADQPVAVQAADAQSLHEAVGRLENQVGSLKHDLRTAQQQLDAANAAADAARAASAAAAAASVPAAAPVPARTRTTSAPVRRAATKAPAVHTKTGASAAGAEHEGGSEGSDD